MRPKVLIAGGGVAGLGTLLALRAAAGDRVDITLVAPEARFVNRSMAVDHPADVPRVRGLKLGEITDEFDASWHRGSIGRVDHRARVVVTQQGAELGYDQLVLALGAQSRREWHVDGVLTYHDAADAHEYRRLVRALAEGRATSVGFVRPAGASWLLPLYELALGTAADCRSRELTVELNLVTPEAQPLEAFGASASADVHAALQALGVRLHTSSVGVPQPSRPVAPLARRSAPAPRSHRHAATPHGTGVAGRALQPGRFHPRRRLRQGHGRGERVRRR